MYKYRILDQNGQELLGKPVPYANIFVSQYPIVEPGEKLVAMLVPGESTKVKYTMSGVPAHRAEVCTIVCVEVPERHFRVTRPLAYPVGSPGYQNHKARQGYYTTCEDAAQARQQIRLRLNLSDEEPLDVEEEVKS